MLRVDYNCPIHDLPPQAPALFEALFAPCQQIIIEKEFTENLSGSRVFLIQPIADDRARLPVVVKLAATRLIEREWQAFETARNMLYGLVEIQNYVNSDGEWGALQYLMQGGGTFKVLSLAQFYREHPTAEVQQVFKRLCRTLSRIHDQNRTQPGFSWRPAYDAVLPLNLLLKPAVPPAHVPICMLNSTTAHHTTLQPGDWVHIEGFTVTKVDLRKHTVTLDLPERGFCIRLQEVEDFSPYQKPSPSLIVEGQIQATRNTQLEQHLHRLWGAAGGKSPAFADATVCTPEGLCLPNPFSKLNAILNQHRLARVALIHGDLNTHNVLVDAEDGFPSLIDITEAREDHVLHDFFRLETEIITRLLPETLAEHGLAPEGAMLPFYQQLHCATFDETPLLTPHLSHPALEKPFAVLRTLRQSARRYLYCDDPTEYYQGLILYLVGALKFANLEQPPHAPLPKQCAFWGAATAQWLLENTQICTQNRSALPEPPHALIIDFTPEVKILRADKRQLEDVTYGASLRRNDTVSTYTAAQAVVHCNKGPIFIIPEERNQRINCHALSQNPLISQLDIHHPDQFTRLAALFDADIADCAAPNRAALLSPRNTCLTETRPTFSWQPVTAAARYRLTLRMPGGDSWQCETSAATLAYPAELPALAWGSRSTIVLETLGENTLSQSAYVQILSAEKCVAVQQLITTIQSLPCSEIGRAILLAQGYQNWRLMAAAIDLLENLVRQTDTLPVVWLQLGLAYLQTGRCQHALHAYHAALQAAAESTEVSAVANLGLACAYHHLNQPVARQQHFEVAAKAGYAEFIAALRQHLRGDAQERPPVLYTGAANLFDYVRFLAANIAPQLAQELRAIPDLFLERLRNMEHFTLKPPMSWSPATLGPAPALETLAATYLATRAFIQAAGADQPPDTLFPTLPQQAAEIAENAIGLSPDQAQAFAERYTNIMKRNMDILRRIIESQEP